MTYFKTEKVEYEGPLSNNPYSFKYYNPDEVIDGKTMKDHLRFSVAYWHTFTADLSDPFGEGAAERDWDSLNELDKAKERVNAIFEFMNKTNIEYFCFHDVDIAPEGKNLEESNQNLDIITDLIKEKMDETGKNFYGILLIILLINVLFMAQLLLLMQMYLLTRLQRSKNHLKLLKN